MPTGTGKTQVFVSIGDRQQYGRVLVLAHRDELINQARDRITQMVGERPDVEKAEQRADRNPWWRTKFVVSSIQTQNAGNGRRMKRFDPKEFSLVIVDEAHHAVAASYQKVLEHYRQNDAIKILGVTATPDRTDELALGKIFRSVAWNYELQSAIEDGWLVPIRPNMVHINGLELSDVHTLGGDFNLGELEQVLSYERPLHGMCDATIQLAGDRKTMMFCASVPHAERCMEIVNRHKPGHAQMVSAKTPMELRRQIISDFSAGSFQFMVNVGVFTEGYDEPGIRVISMCRPTKSRSLYTQMVGRGTRVLPELPINETDAAGRRNLIAGSDKPHLEIYDFVGNSGRHKLVTAVDILGGNYEDAVVERAKEQAEGADGAIDIDHELAAAEEYIRKTRERDLRQKIKVNAKYSVTSLDPYDILGVTKPAAKGWNTGRPVSDKMSEFLRNKGVDPTLMTFDEAKGMVGKLIERTSHGWCTFKQAKTLRRFGYEPKGIRFSEASRLIDQIAGNGWRRPDD